MKLSFTVHYESACFSAFYYLTHTNNESYVFLVGFPDLHNFSILLFIFLLIVYCVTIFGNVIIITLVSVNRNLHSPMYFFITHVSFLDIMMTTTILPILLYIVLHEGMTMSFTACISQFWAFGSLETLECLILMVMSYDRYVAICNPLRYSSIINKNMCVTSVIGSWLLSFLLVLIYNVEMQNVNFCRANIIDHFFCDFSPILEISCSDILFVKIQGSLFGFIIILCPFIIIVVSYVHIITTILNIRSISGRQKAFSTCSSHLTVVCLYFGTLISVYVVLTKGKLSAISKALSLLYTVVTPMLNPFIYSLRNKDIKETLKKCQIMLNYKKRSKI